MLEKYKEYLKLLGYIHVTIRKGYVNPSFKYYKLRGDYESYRLCKVVEFSVINDSICSILTFRDDGKRVRNLGLEEFDAEYRSNIRDKKLEVLLL